MRKLGLSFLTVLALVTSVLLPTQVATAAPAASLPATKTVTVTDHNGAPYAGAQVAFSYFDATLQNYVSTPLVVTNSSGVAVVDVSDISVNAYVDGLIVEPPISDTQNATFFGYTGAQVGNTSFNVQLSLANVRVQLVNSDGTPAAAGSKLNAAFQTNSGADAYTRKIIRTGAFGLDLAPIVDLNQVTTLRIDSSFWKNNFGQTFGLKASPDSQVFQPLLYTDASATTPLVPTSGVYTLSFARPQLTGTLQDAFGNHLTLASPITAFITVLGAAPDGSPDPAYQWWQAISAVNTDGTFKLLIPGLPAGKYFPQVFVSGSKTIPSFVGSPFWIDSSGKASQTQQGTYTPVAQFSLAVKVPAAAPNFKVSYGDPQGNALPVSLNLSGGSGYLGSDHTSNGIASWSLADGSYFLWISPDDNQRVGDSATVNVSGGVASVTDSAGNPIAADSQGVFKLYSKSANLRLRFVSPETGAPQVQSEIDISQVGSNSTNAMNTNLAGELGANLSDGSYDLVLQTFGSNPLWSPKSYRLTVSANGTNFAVVDANGLSVNPDSGGAFNLSPALSNLILNVVDPANPSKVIWNPQISIEKTTADGTQSNFYGGSGGLVAALVSDGSYSLDVRPDPTNPRQTDKYFNLVVSGSSINLSDAAGNAVASSNGRFTVAPATSNVVLTVVKPGSSALVVPTASVVVGSGSSYQGHGLNQGVLGLNLGDGTYQLITDPQSSDPKLSQSRFTMVVSNSGASVVVTDASGSNVPASPDGVFALALTAANLPLQVVNPFVSSQIMTNAQVGYNLLDLNGNPVSSSFSGTNQGRTGLSLADGHYQLIIQPNSTDTAIANSFYDVVVSSGQVAVTNQSGNSVSPDINGIYNLAAGTSNFVAQIEDPDAPGVALGHAYVNVDQIVAGGSRHIMGTFAGLGAFGLQLTDGAYLVQVQPDPADTAKTPKTYHVNVSSNGAQVVVADGLGNPVLAAPNGTFSLPVGRANVVGQIADSNGLALPVIAGSWTVVQLQKWSTQYNQWIYSSSSSADANGNFGLTVSEPGNYRLKIESGGRSDVSTTYSSEFLVADASAVQSLDKNLGKVNLNAPTLLVSARTSSGTSDLAWAQISVRDGNNTDWVFTGNSGIAPISFAHAGTYQVGVQPKGDGTTPNSTAKTYTVDVTTDSNGLLVANVRGLSKELNGSYILRLGVPNLSGSLKDPTGTTSMPYNQIMPMNATTGELLWQYSTSTDSSGNWALNLPAGQYKLVSLAPTNLGTYGHGVSSAVVTIDSQGNATATGGANPNSLALRLSNPTWSGIVTEPGTSSVMANVSVCLGFGQLTGTFNNTCTSTNQDGKWAITAPAEFTGFDDSSWLQINENGNAQYAQNRYQGKAAVESALGVYVTGQQQAGIVLKPKAPNTAISVTAGGTPVSNTWVQFYDAQGQYLGGAQTNIDGVAKVNLNNPGTDVTLDINVQNDPTLTGKFAGIRRAFLGNQFANNNGFYSLSVALPKPNFQAIVREPSPAADVVRNSYLDIFNGQDGTWLGNASIDSNGFVSGNLAAPANGTANYVLTVHNSWNATSNFVEKSYLATVDSAGGVVITPKSGNGSVTSETYLGSVVSTLYLAKPSLIGKVNLPDGVTSVANSWVAITDSQTNQWVSGTSSKQDGSFAATVADGSYALEANVPWGTTGLAKSAPCLVTVSADATTTSGTNCVDANGVVGLKLRAPNLTFTLMDGSGPNAKPVPFASVGMGLGAWNTWAQSDKNGQVSLFVDTAEIAAKNPSLTGTQALSVWVDPPFGNSNIVRWQCASGDTSKPLCGDLPSVTIGQDFNAGITKNLGNVVFLQPNARLQVLYPAAGGSAQPVEAGSWVAIYQTNQSNCSGCRNWVAGGNTDSNGFVSFNLPDVTSGATYSVEVNAPWQKRSQFAQNVTDGVLGSDLASTLVAAPTFSLTAPNLAVTVQQASGNGVSKWAGMGVEKIDATSGAWLGWVGWFGADDKGGLSTLLASSARYRLTVYPGGGSKGATTTCLVDVDSNGVVSLVAGMCTDGSDLAGTGLQTLTITLSLGNVTGTVVAPDHSTLVAGAIVVATAVDGSHSAIAGVATQQFTTGADGKYGFQLDPAYTWDLKVYFVPVPGSGASYSSNLVPTTVQPGVTSTPIQLEVL